MKTLTGQGHEAIAASPNTGWIPERRQANSEVYNPNRILSSVPASPHVCSPLRRAPARRVGVSPDTLEITVVAPEPRLVIRPRLYERAPETMVAPLAEVFDAVDVRYEQGRVDVIDSASKSV
jgi:hypothetical protein